MDDRERETRDPDAALELLRLAGPRQDVPAAVEARVRAEVRTYWQQRVTARRRLRWMALAVPLAVAAALVVGVALSRLSSPTAVPSLATVEVIRGEVHSHQDGRRQLLAEGDSVPAGTIVETGKNGRTALRLEHDVSLRLDAGTRLAVQGERRFELDRGAVYIDSGADEDRLGVTLVTPHGEVRDIGTRFEVRLASDSLRVRVRDGRVRVERRPEAIELGAKQEAELNADGSVALRPVAAGDPGWAWILDVAPAFQVEGRSAAAFLGWVTNETGWELRWSEPALALSADRMILHGDIAGLRPDQAPDVVLPTCGLAHHVEDGALVVGIMTD